MGYELHITRRRHWSDGSGAAISLQEWLEYVERDPELRLDDSLGEIFAVWTGPSKHEIPWLAWSGGNIESKFPDEPLIRKMVRIAADFGAEVQGDDGETYGYDALPQKRREPSLAQRFTCWWRNLVSPRVTPVDETVLPFKVGDRVQDIFGNRNQGMITEIDGAAENGLGRIAVKYDDGRVVYSAAYGHGLERAE